MSLKEIDADFVISYGSKGEDGQLVKLTTVLYDKGFYVQARDLDKSGLLLFVRLSGFKYAELREKDLIKNYEFGITSLVDNPADRSRIIYDFLTGNTIDDLNLFEFKHVKDIAPITPTLKPVSITDVIKTNPSTQFIKEHFGIHVALYFEFLKYFITWLFFLSVFGIISYFKSKHSFSLTFCFINLVWGTLFISFWKKRESYLVSFWGNSNYHLIQDHKLELVDINEHFEQKSDYKHSSNTEGIKFLKQLIFVPVAIGFAAVLIAYQLGCFVLEIFINEVYDGPGKTFVGLIPTILISVFVPILTIIFNIFSDIIIKLENHNNDYTKNNSILIKQFILNFLTGYMPLIITSFIYLPFAHLIQPNLTHIHSSIQTNLNSNAFYYKYLTHIKKQEDFNMNQDRLNGQFFYFMVINQVVQLVMKYALPLAIKFVTGLLAKKDYTPKDRKNEAQFLSTVRLYVSLPSYNVNDDFRFVTLVYGYLILFGPVWSLGALFTIVFAYITLKLDYWKLLNGKNFKPSIPQRVDSIYPWNYALFILTWLGSIVSPAITAFYHHGVKPPKTLGQFALDKASVNISSSHLLFILLISEHSFLIVWYVLGKLITFFKSQTEWEDDFTDKDIKLRHDYYSAKVKGDLSPPPSDGDWETFSVRSTLNQIDQIKAGGLEDDVEEEPKATTTGLQTTELYDTDHIIQVSSEDKKVAATIDDNEHVQQDGHGAYQKDYENSESDVPEEAQGLEDNSDDVEDVGDGEKKKKSSLKKLLKRKK